MFKPSLFLLFIFVNSFFCNNIYATDSINIVKKGVAHLENIDFKNELIPLDGDWGFEWKQLVFPNEKKVFNRYFHFPQKWNGSVVNGEMLTSIGFATYQVQLILPKNRKSLAINMPSFYSCHRLFVNGIHLSNSGYPGKTIENYSPHWNTSVVALPDNVDTINIILQIANFSHARGGVKQGITIGDKHILYAARERWIAADFLLTGCLFMSGLFFFGLYLFGKKDKAMLYFSLFSILYSYRIIGSSFYALHSVFPYLKWELTTRLEYFSLFGSVYFFNKYVNELYPKDVYKPLARILSICLLILLITSVVTSTLFFTQLIYPFLIIMFSNVFYVLYIFIKAFVNKRPTSEYALLSIIVLTAILIIINLEYFQLLIPSRKFVFAGYVCFFFLQSLILSFRFSFTLNRTAQLAEQGLKSKTEFLSTMSHEIRTPLNSVIGMSHLMLKNNPRKDQKEQLDVLLFSAGNLLSIVNNILEYSKIEAGKIKFETIEMDLINILQNIVYSSKTAVEEKNIEIKLILPPILFPKVNGDPTRFVQVINNLVGNAIKFTQTGSVIIEILLDEISESNISVTFKIKDTGIGISKEKQQLIFEQFTQADSSTSRRFGGTGLGLAISKKILELQNSHLHLYSEEGVGSIFYFTQTFSISKTFVPVVMNSLPEIKNDSTVLAGIQILLVEDNPINVFVAKSFLEGWGAIIEVAENGQIALDLLDENRHQIILMDLHMPIMDGYEATTKIRQQGIKIPIIALTATMPDEVAEEVKDLGIDGMVLKPFVPEELCKMVERFVHKA